MYIAPYMFLYHTLLQIKECKNKKAKAFSVRLFDYLFLSVCICDLFFFSISTVLVIVCFFYPYKWTYFCWSVYGLICPRFDMIRNEFLAPPNSLTKPYSIYFSKRIIGTFKVWPYVFMVLHLKDKKIISNLPFWW